MRPAANSLKLLRRQWERNAKVDPFWTILTQGRRRSIRWDHETFFATGRGDVTRHLDLLSGTGFSVRPGLALDFGCGLGRLTSPLADAFGSAVGVDVSLGMVEMARKLHSGKPNLRFVHNDQLDLSIFAPNTFDFVYSLITLQHMPQDLAKGYLAEMVRVCRPSSFILVQIVTTRHQRASWFWPPTLAKLAWRAFNRRMALAPVLEMFPMPESDARRAMVGAGAEIIAVLPDGAAGSSFESRLIVARAKNCP